MLASRSFERSRLTRARGRLALSVLISSLAIAAPVRAAPPSDDDSKSQLVGKPVALSVQPSAMNLIGPKSTQQIVVTGIYPEGAPRDLTAFCDFSVEPPA